MTIPESQLVTWAKFIDSDRFPSTNNSLQNAADSIIKQNTTIKYRYFLQGSYKNATTIRASSDIDFVVMLTSTWYRDISQLSDVEKECFLNYFPPSNYNWDAFRYDVNEAMRNYYENDIVSLGDKTIKIKGVSNRLDSDIVVCAEHRIYHGFSLKTMSNYTAGIILKNCATNEWIINYPEQHFKYGAKKHQKTKQSYKKAIRVFKNAYKYMCERDMISSDLASSYFIECLLYNVPNEVFESPLAPSVSGCLQWLAHANLNEFWCQNKILKLFGAKSTQWNVKDAEEFIDSLTLLWDKWWQL